MHNSPDSAVPASGFFTHHGPWAIGVRLFRRLNFHAKAWLISWAFLLPIGLLGGVYLQSRADAIAFSAKERIGIAYARDLVPLLALLQAERLAAAQGAAAGSPPSALVAAAAAVSEQWKRVQVAQAAYAEELGTAPAYEALRQAFDARSAGGADLAAVLKAHSAAVEAAIALVTQVADGSNLTLDPDLDTYYLMDAVFTRVPVLAEATAWTHSALAAGDGAGAVALRQLARQDAIATYMKSGLQTAVDKVVGQHAELRAPLSTAAAFDALLVLQKQAARADAGERPDAAAVSDAGEAAARALQALQAHALQDLDGLIEARIDTAANGRNAVTAAVIVCLMAAGYLFHSFFLVMSGGLNETRRHLRAMTEGDLTTSPSPWGRDEAAQLMLSLSEMQASVRQIVGRVRGASDGIVSAASQISAGAHDLSERTERSAASLQQSASAMEQISATVRQTSDTVQQAAQVATGNAREAERGGQIIGTMVTTMQDIHAASSRIGDIIATIDGIAFQTNILALNAAVEAARAGEAGRGFAVVASEVRTLAQRSSQAAREIKDLIVASVDKVEAGTTVVREAGAAIDEIVGTARRVNGLLAEIATSAGEQARGVTQTTVSVHDLDEATQQNAALVEETAAAASALTHQALGLAQEVSRFRLPVAA